MLQQVFSPRYIHHRIALLVLAMCFLSLTAMAQPLVWQASPESSFSQPDSRRVIIPQRYATFSLDVASLEEILRATGRANASGTANQQEFRIPMPDGRLEAFRISEAPIMAPELAAKYPMIRTFSGKGIDDPTATVRLDLTPKGFHAIVLSGRHSTVYVDPYAPGDVEHYIAYYQSDSPQNTRMHCDVRSNLSVPALENPQMRTLGDCQLRTYRLAMACTGEYGVYHGGTKVAALAAMTTTMNRVNAIFERDLGITMTFVANMDTLIFTDPQNDPYDGTSNASTFFDNQQVVDSLIGNANYDIGHVLLTVLGGSAWRGSVCNSIDKAGGCSGNPVPVGDPLDVEYVAHEMGHQFGASHTNNSCNAAAFTAVEPGSGSTIMSPASCTPSIQAISDGYFHIATIAEMSNYIMNGQGGTCPTTTQTTNNPPNVDGGDPRYILPVSTPFRLSATGTDVDNDSLTYCWEQMDTHTVSHPPLPTHETGPMFRSFEPVDDPTRYFPRLSDLVNGTNYDWEELPAVGRTMHFRVTARDNAVPAACIDVDDVELIFTERAGPFLVNSPSGNTTWLQGATETVNWDVAGTDIAPVSCAAVDILLSTDGGLTYPTVLASGVPNDGYHPILVPNLATTNARVMVICSDNVFFNISNGDFTIQPASTPTFSGTVIPFEGQVCAPGDSVEFNLYYSALGSFSNTVTLSATGLPAGATASFSQTSFVPGATPSMTIFTPGTVAPGTYTVSIVAASSTVTSQQDVQLEVVDAVPAAVSLISPPDGATGVPATPTYTWTSGSSEEVIEIATNPGFGNSIVETRAISGGTYLPDSSLNPNTVYYWRVRALNDCGDSDGTEVHCFQTLQESCLNFASTNVPVSIPPDPSSASSVITPNINATVTDVDVSLEILTTYAGGIKADLISPASTTVSLFDRPRFPGNGGPFGCTRDNIRVTLDDETHTSSAWLEEMCVSGSNYGVAGNFQPISPLSAVDGENAQGSWTLAITNSAGSGSIVQWSLKLCTLETPDPAPSLINLGLTLPAPGSQGNISSALLSASSLLSQPSQITFTVLALPSEGTLNINGSPAVIGSTFTQADIDNQQLDYLHQNTVPTTDFFVFDVVTDGGGWIHNDTFFVYAGAVGIGQPLNVKDLNMGLYPNPTDHSVSLFIQQQTGPFIEVRIVDVNGKIVRAAKFEKTTYAWEQRIDVQDLAAGTYQLLISDGEHLGAGRFVKQ